MAKQVGKNGESCGICKFFFSSGIVGTCHFNPPSGSDGFPAVGTGHWCGQFQKEQEDSDLLEAK